MNIKYKYRIITVVGLMCTAICMVMSVYVEAKQAEPVKCGDILRITHIATGAHLHSHPYNYGHPNTSGQQQITAYQGTDYNDLWIIRSPCTNPVQNGGVIRLEHVATKRYLHSHLNIPAPVTRSQQEVTGWGGGNITDTNDIWKVEVDGGGVWTTNKQVRLIHVNTNAALHSHPNLRHAQWTMGQQEVTAYSGRDYNDFWKADHAVR
ncbi:MAG: MIR domain-containing protein [Candidatus Electronema sp. V4]|uniref:MIR domain-containing protein n=1 Tax=Candidatus Electronema sp. V4 TaxID=3454756 RepID=UPI0040556B5E